MSQETIFFLIKPYLAHICVAMLAGLVRWLLLPSLTRTWVDYVTFFVFALFVSIVVSWVVSPLGFDKQTISALSALGALMAQELIKGALQLVIRLFPAIEKKILSKVEHWKL